MSEVDILIKYRILCLCEIEKTKGECLSLKVFRTLENVIDHTFLETSMLWFITPIMFSKIVYTN